MTTVYCTYHVYREISVVFGGNRWKQQLSSVYGQSYTVLYILIQSKLKPDAQNKGVVGGWVSILALVVNGLTCLYIEGRVGQ